MLPSIVQAASAALTMERTPFAIDDARDDDDSDDDEFEDGEEGEGGDDEVVMDEVDAFLEAHDSGLTDADQEVAKGALFFNAFLFDSFFFLWKDFELNVLGFLFFFSPRVVTCGTVEVIFFFLVEQA